MMPIQRGDIYQFNLEAAPGLRRQSGIRSCVVLSLGAYNDKLPTVGVVPLTTARRELPPIVVCVPSAGHENSMVLCNQARTLDKSRIVGGLQRRLSVEDLQKVENGVRRYYGL